MLKNPHGLKFVLILKIRLFCAFSVSAVPRNWLVELLFPISDCCCALVTMTFFCLLWDSCVSFSILPQLTQLTLLSFPINLIHWLAFSPVSSYELTALKTLTASSYQVPLLNCQNEQHPRGLFGSPECPWGPPGSGEMEPSTDHFFLDHTVIALFPLSCPIGLR